MGPSHLDDLAVGGRETPAPLERNASFLNMPSSQATGRPAVLAPTDAAIAAIRKDMAVLHHFRGPYPLR